MYDDPIHNAHVIEYRRIRVNKARKRAIDAYRKIRKLELEYIETWEFDIAKQIFELEQLRRDLKK